MSEVAVAQLLQCYSVLTQVCTAAPPVSPGDGDEDEDSEDEVRDSDDDANEANANAAACSDRLKKRLFLSSAARAGVASKAAESLACELVSCGNNESALDCGARRRTTIATLDETYSSQLEGYIDPRAVAGIGLSSTSFTYAPETSHHNHSRSYSYTSHSRAPSQQGSIVTAHSRVSAPPVLASLPFLQLLTARLGAGLFTPLTVTLPLPAVTTPVDRSRTAPSTAAGAAGVITPLAVGPRLLTIAHAPDPREAASARALLQALYKSCARARRVVRKALGDALAVFVMRSGASVALGSAALPAITVHSKASNSSTPSHVNVSEADLEAPLLWSLTSSATKMQTASQPQTPDQSSDASACGPGVALLNTLLSRGLEGAAGINLNLASSLHGNSAQSYRSSTGAPPRIPAPQLPPCGAGAVAPESGVTARVEGGSAAAALLSAGPLYGEAGGVAEALQLIHAVMAPLNDALLQPDNCETTTTSAPGACKQEHSKICAKFPEANECVCAAYSNNGNEHVSASLAKKRLNFRLLLTVVAELWCTEGMVGDASANGHSLAGSSGMKVNPVANSSSALDLYNTDVLGLGTDAAASSDGDSELTERRAVAFEVARLVATEMQTRGDNSMGGRGSSDFAEDDEAEAAAAATPHSNLAVATLITKSNSQHLAPSSSQNATPATVAASSVRVPSRFAQQAATAGTHPASALSRPGSGSAGGAPVHSGVALGVLPGAGSGDSLRRRALAASSGIPVAPHHHHAVHGQTHASGHVPIAGPIAGPVAGPVAGTAPGGLLFSLAPRGSAGAAITPQHVSTPMSAHHIPRAGPLAGPVMPGGLPVQLAGLHHQQGGLAVRLAGARSGPRAGPLDGPPLARSSDASASSANLASGSLVSAAAAGPSATGSLASLFQSAGAVSGGAFTANSGGGVGTEAVLGAFHEPLLRLALTAIKADKVRAFKILVDRTFVLLTAIRLTSFVRMFCSVCLLDAVFCLGSPGAIFATCAVMLPTAAGSQQCKGAHHSASRGGDFPCGSTKTSIDKHD